MQSTMYDATESTLVGGAAAVQALGAVGVRLGAVDAGPDRVRPPQRCGCPVMRRAVPHVPIQAMQLLLVLPPVLRALWLGLLPLALVLCRQYHSLCVHCGPQKIFRRRRTDKEASVA